jgi:transposase
MQGWDRRQSEVYWFSVNWNLPPLEVAVTLSPEVLPMTEKRKHYSGPDKVAILRLHLLEKKPVSDLCDQYGIHPTLFYRWQKEFFENGAAAFEQHGKRCKAVEEGKDRRIAALESKLQQKNEVLAELMQEYVQLKKELGEP